MIRHPEPLIAKNHRQRTRPMHAGKLRSLFRKRETKRLDRRRIRGEKRDPLSALASLDRVQTFDGIRKTWMRGKTIYRIRRNHRHAAGVQNRRSLVKRRIIAGKYPHWSLKSFRKSATDLRERAFMNILSGAPSRPNLARIAFSMYDL